MTACAYAGLLRADHVPHTPSNPRQRQASRCMARRHKAARSPLRLLRRHGGASSRLIHTQATGLQARAQAQATPRGAARRRVVAMQARVGVAGTAPQQQSRPLSHLLKAQKRKRLQPQQPLPERREARAQCHKKSQRPWECPASKHRARRRRSTIASHSCHWVLYTRSAIFTLVL